MEYEIVEGVDGSDLNLRDPAIIDPSALTKRWFCPAAAGCALSHLRVYQKILRDPVDRALVLEDDVILPDDLGRSAEDIAEHLRGAEVALLNYDSRDVLRVSREGSMPLSSSQLLGLPVDMDQPRSTAAYLITREACKRLSANMPPVREEADYWGFFCRKGMLERVRCVVPMLVVKNPAFESTRLVVKNNDFTAPALANLKVRLDKLPLLHQAILSRRRRFLSQQTRIELVDEPPS